ncbi:hypothetical protein PIB30_033388 [Stylosanthes scabra]|uniref:Uncharacterized protein n=1 Tax=Stylosanthes scabra TaxID=79078 RepID=A0ABU6QBX0_9FABA|nr:hypothetical protein [Stylosanthes scabra]
MCTTIFGLIFLLVSLILRAVNLLSDSSIIISLLVPAGVFTEFFILQSLLNKPEKSWEHSSVSSIDFGILFVRLFTNGVSSLRSFDSLFGGKVLHASASGALSPLASGQSAESNLVYFEKKSMFLFLRANRCLRVMPYLKEKELVVRTGMIAHVHGVCALHIVGLDGGQRLHEFPHFDHDFDFYILSSRRISSCGANVKVGSLNDCPKDFEWDAEPQ